MDQEYFFAIKKHELVKLLTSSDRSHKIVWLTTIQSNISIVKGMKVSTFFLITLTWKLVIIVYTMFLL